MALETPAQRNYVEIGDVALAMRQIVNRTLWPLGIILAGVLAAIALAGNPGAVAYGLISVSTLVVLASWAKQGRGLPIVPMLAIQNLAIYALPVVIGSDVILKYSGNDITAAGWEVFASNIAMILAWRIGMTAIPNYSRWCYALQGFDLESPSLHWLGYALLVGGTAYETLQSAGVLDWLIDLLPTGSWSIVHALVSAMSACGFFLVGMMIGRGKVHQTGRAIFWAMLILQCFVSAAGFLLSASITVLFSVAIGLFWGSGRVPWRFLIISFSIFAFLNLGKFTMRDRYWHVNEDDVQPQCTLTDMPRYYGEWIGVSFDALIGNTAVNTANKDSFAGFGESQKEKADSEQNLLTRINNLQNLLFVIDAMERKHIPPVGGATYSLIPPLLVPRVIWPNKPRTHEGQILLNVYFGRQDLSSTYQTYIAWGLLPEAYANFGPIAGAIILGLGLGLLFAWVEKFVARKLLLSVEGFLSFTLLLGMANSYEMVASVLVTSIFQSFVPIVLACAPFVARLLPKRRADESAVSA